MTRTPSLRIGLSCLTALILAAAPAMAQDPKLTPQTAPRTSAPQTSPPQTSAPAPGSEEWLRQRGESYSAAPDAEQDPAELSETRKLNEGIAARNAAASETEARDQARFEAESQSWRDESARSSTARVQWEADVAAANAAQARWERERAAYEAEVAACRASGRTCITPGPSPK